MIDLNEQREMGSAGMTSQTTQNSTGHVLLWGWLRLWLGLIQMALAAASFWALWQFGLQETTWNLILGATLTTLLSRFLYRRRAKSGAIVTTTNDAPIARATDKSALD